MIREDKVAAVKKMNEAFQSAPHIILASFRGLTVNQANVLRRKIDGAGGRYSVVKNRLAKLAAAGTHVEKLADKLTGPCALITHDSDPVAVAKALTEFTKDNPQVEVVAAVLDGEAVIDASAVSHLAKLPGMPELRAQLLAMLNTPATTLVRLLGTPASQLARVLDARVQAEGGGEGS